MAGRGRLLLEPGFVYDEVNLTPPPQVSRVFDWPRPKTTENQHYDSYSSDDDEEPSPVPISEPRTRKVMAVIPSVRPWVPRPASIPPSRRRSNTATACRSCRPNSSPAQQHTSHARKKCGPCARPAQLTKAIHHRPGGTQTAIFF
ncbi:hypothetical protein DAPPUDRAFT_263851 [Daphnia pulex]|uniref:Uncharacterized protein n=1 Tax=Daphnia pulex TaxID=6669 RepID=E9HQI3_DAPPU|nr:hypothetical protein DAPPUDRAFT_263851 [Daphnia pulex]|eukprot:EFX66003.1 hypothetical protein DAPPUDRAFT_263851 [Daphnia pulex]